MQRMRWIAFVGAIVLLAPLKVAFAQPSSGQSDEQQGQYQEPGTMPPENTPPQQGLEDQPGAPPQPQQGREGQPGTQGTQNNQYQQGTQPGTQQGTQQGMTQQFTGKVVRLKLVKIQGTSIQNKVVMLQSADNRQLVVDLGPATQTPASKVYRGSQLSVQGKLSRVGDQAVLFADNVTLNGETSTVSRTGEEQGSLSSSQSQNKQAQKQVSGTILQSKQVPIQGTNQQDTVILFQPTNSRESLIVDLGRSDRLSGVNLNQGQQLTVTGRQVQVGDRLVLFADSITAYGRTVRTERGLPMPPG